MELNKRIKDMVNSGMSYRAVAKEVGVSSAKVSNVVNDVFAYNKGWRKKESIRMYQSGMTISQIAEKMNLEYSTVWAHLKDVRTTAKRRVLDHKRIAYLAQMGFTTDDIAINIGTTANVIRHSLRKHGNTPKRVVFDNAADKEISSCLFIDGYSVDQISLMMGILPSSVKRYVRGLKMHRIEMSEKKKIIKKPKPVKPSAIEQRAVIGKGVTSGIYSLEVRLRPDRDDGILLGIVYRDLGNVNKEIRIRIKESEDKESKAKNWCKKFGKKYVNYF